MRHRAAVSNDTDDDDDDDDNNNNNNIGVKPAFLLKVCSHGFSFIFRFGVRREVSDLGKTKKEGQKEVLHLSRKCSSLSPKMACNACNCGS